MRRHVVFSIALSFVGVLALVPTTACDPFPDECELDDNVCEGNVANLCYRPGPESRLVTKRTDCGASKTCTISRSGEAICAERDLPPCDVVDARECHGASLATCTARRDGPNVWVPMECAKGCEVTSYGPGCVYR